MTQDCPLKSYYVYKVLYNAIKESGERNSIKAAIKIINPPK